MTTAVFNTSIGEVKNKTPKFSGLVWKMDYITKTSEIEAKNFKTSDYNKITSKILETKMKEKRLVGQSSIFNPVKISNLNTKLTLLATKAGLKAEQDRIVQL